MANSESDNAIGFPPPLLGDKPFRLPVLQKGEGWIALEKPIGALIDAHPLYPEVKTMVEGIRVQASAGKPELERLGVSKVSSVFLLEPEVHGIALLANSSKAREELRNAFGSMQFEFCFELLCWGTTENDELVCEAPLNYYPKEGRVIISKRHGKKAKTNFVRSASGNGISRWLAHASYLRPEQIRIHAEDVDLKIIGGDNVMDDESSRGIRKGIAERVKPLGLCLRLKSIHFPFDGEKISIEAPVPKLWRSPLKQIEVAD